MGDKQIVDGVSTIDALPTMNGLQTSPEIQQLPLSQMQGEQSRSAYSHLKDAEDVDPKRGSPFEEAISQFDILQFQNCFYECIEELRIHRVIDAENEEKINQLISIQHDHQRAIKEEISKNGSLAEKHSQELGELRRQHDEKINQLEAEKSKLALAADSWEKEMKELKDDIRTLQLTKYSLEKTVKDQDQRLQMQGSARSSHLSKMTELEALGKDIGKRCNAVAEQLKMLEVNVKESKKLNSRLSFINQHQTCVSESLKADLKTKSEEIVSLRALLDGKQNQEDVEMKAIRSKQSQTEQQLKQKGNTCKDLLEQLEAAKSANQSSLEALLRSQQLSERHLTCSNQSAELAASLSKDIENHEREIAQLREDVYTKEEQLKAEEQRRQEFAAKTQIKEEFLRTQLRIQQDENQSLIKARENLEELNTSWSKKNIEMVETIRELEENIDEFERREKEKPKKETKSTNTEAEQLQQKVEAAVGLPKENSTSESESNYDTVSIQEGEDSKTVTPQRAGEVSETSEDSSRDQISMQIETTTTEQVPISAQCEQSELGVAVKDGTARVIEAGDHHPKKVEIDVKFDPLGPDMEEDAKICQPEGGLTYLRCSNESDSKSTSNAGGTSTAKYAEAGDAKPEKGDGLQIMVQKQGDLCKITDETSETVKHKCLQSPPVENQQIAKEGKTPADEHVSSKEAINQVDADVSINQVASQGTVSQVTPPNTTNQIVSHDNANKSDFQIAISQTAEKPTSQLASLKAINQMTLLETNTHVISPKDIQVNSQKPINQLDSCDSQSAMCQFIQKKFVKQDLDKNEVSDNAEQATEVNETLQLTSNKDIDKVKGIQDVSSTASGTGLANLSKTNPLMSKSSSYKQASVTKVQTPSSLPNYLNVSKIGTRPSYILPGFSLLTAQPRRGVTPRVNPFFSLSPSSSHCIRKVPGTIPTSADNTLIKTPTERKPHDCLNPVDKCSSPKGKEGSQEWPNFAEEFDSGPNTAPLCMDYSTSLRIKPTARVASTVVPQDVGSKRPAEDDQSLLFSDEDDETDIKSDVASQINRIQSFLRRDRLKRSRRSNSTAKEPVV